MSADGAAPMVESDGFHVTSEQLSMLGDGDVRRGRRVLRGLIMDERERSPIKGPTARPDNVRIATANDETAIYNLVVMEMEEVATVAPINPDSIATQIMSGTRYQRGIIGVIDGPDGFPVATIGIFNERWWWSTSWHFVKVWEFVHPDHRQTGFAKDLINFMHWFNDDMTRQFGYPVFTLSGVLTTKRMKDKVRLYRRMSNPMGAFFLYPQPPGVTEDG